MVDSYVQVPTDESGKMLRTWTSGSVHSESVVLSLADTNNTFIDPRYVTISGATVPIGATGSITGSINNWPSTYAVTESGQWKVNVTGSSPDSSVVISGSVNQLGQWQVNATGSITGSINNWPSTYAVTKSGTWTVTGSIDNWPSTYAVTQNGNWNVTGSINNTVAVSESGQWAVYATGSGPSGAVLVTGSVYQAGAWNVTGSINNWPTSYTVVGMAGVTGSGPSSAVLVTGSVYQAGNWNVTGSINNTVSVAESGQWVVFATGSGTNQAVIVTGSIDRINNTVIIVGTAGVTGSGPSSAVLVTGSVYQAGTWNVTGSINNWPTSYAVIGTAGITGSGPSSAVLVTGSVYQAGSWNVTGSINNPVTGSINNWPSTYTLASKSYKSQGVSGSISANSAASILTGVANKHLKVYSIIYNQSGSSVNQIAFFSSGSGLANAQLLGPMPLGINEGFANGVSPPAWILCTAVTGSTLYVSSSAAAIHGGVLSFWDDDAT